MSTHLAILSRAELVKSEKLGKAVIYRAITAPAEDLSDLPTLRFSRGGKQPQLNPDTA